MTALTPCGDEKGGYIWLFARTCLSLYPYNQLKTYCNEKIAHHPDPNASDNDCRSTATHTAGTTLYRELDTLPVPTTQVPYYKWSDFRSFYQKRIASVRN